MAIVTSPCFPLPQALALDLTQHHRHYRRHSSTIFGVGSSSSSSSSRMQPPRTNSSPSLCNSNSNSNTCFGSGNSRRRRPRNRNQEGSLVVLFSSEYDDDDLSDEDEYEEENFLRTELANIESMEDLLLELENGLEHMLEDNDDHHHDLARRSIISRSRNSNGGLGDFENDEDVEQLFSFLELDERRIIATNEEEVDEDEDEDEENNHIEIEIPSELEKALLQGVVPAEAGVGSECLPGDWDFDPLDLASKDYILQAQYRLLQLLPGTEPEPPPGPRPKALILRDYREAEIRHGRLAMLAAVIWPLQEMLDKLLLEEDQFGPLLFGPITLAYFPLLMILCMMLLGYLDIYAKAIQEKEELGDAFLPGDCFWDPLQMLQGAPARMERNMQERELFNGRVAMLAFAAYVWEEATTRLPVIEVPGNELLFLPAYQIPYIQEWLDIQFSSTIHNF